MKVVALLSWYDEPPAWLAATVTSCAKFCDHVVAVDGAYFLFPDGKATSGVEQSEAILEAAYGAGIGCTVHRPDRVWIGNEVEKRAFMFALAETMTTEDDWYFPIDADEVVTTCAPDVRDALERSELDAADITLFTRIDLNVYQANAGHFDRTSHHHRQVFRALRGLTVVDTHHHYRVGDRYLWGPGQVEGEDLTPILEVEHRDPQRSLARSMQKDRYYQRRDELGIECVAS